MLRDNSRCGRGSKEEKSKSENVVVDLRKLLDESAKSEETHMNTAPDEAELKEASLPKYILAEIRTLEGVSFYHGMAARDVVERKLLRTGDFLVRATDNRVMEFEFILSFYNKRRFHSHFTIKRDQERGQWHIAVVRNQFFPTIVKLIKHFRTHPMGHDFVLGRGISKGKHLISHDRCVYDSKTDLLGAGHFSSVYKGRLELEYGSVKVAYKYTKALDDVLDPEKNANANKVKKEMIAEAQVMSQLRHANITAFFGMAADVMPVLLVIEFCQGGDLCSHLERRGARISHNERVLYIVDACSGLKYIHAMSITHRDIAARNCLISVKGFVKLADFGMGAKMRNQEQLLVTKKGAHCPARWMAPELIRVKASAFGKPSDMWAFGILMYEIFANGKKPHWELENVDVLKVVKSGKHPRIAADAGKLIHHLASQVFRLDADARINCDTFYEQLMTEVLMRNTISQEMLPSLVLNEIPGVKRERLAHFASYVPQVVAYDDKGVELGWQDAPDEMLANVVWRERL